jgi:hypothetical protein
LKSTTAQHQVEEEETMKRKDWDTIVIAATLLSGGYTALTGLLTDLLNMPLPVFHDYAGYACTALAAAHAILNWKTMVEYLKRRIGLIGKKGQ